MPLSKDIRAAGLAIAPTALPVLVALAGLMLLVSGATPSDPDRFRWLVDVFPAAVIDASHFISSIIGLLLLLMAFGLRRRVGAAWGAAASLLLLAALLALLKGVDWEETAALAVVWLLVLPARKAFFRKAELTALEVTPVWLISALAVVLGAFVLTFWSYSSLRIYDQLWWRLIGDADSARSLRAATGAALSLMAIGVWRLFATPHTPKIIGDEDPDFVRVRAILANADEPDPEAQIALLGDKRFLFSQSGESFLMFGVRGRSWIALGAPVGRRSERLELLWRFRELADAHAARKGVYGIGPDLLPDLVEMGLAIQKIGESAAVPLETFSIAGRRREVLRRNWRRVQELGAGFEVVEPSVTSDLIPELQTLSDQWLGRHAGGDKRFTMGGFEPRYVAEFPCALVRIEGQIHAFATLWTTPDQSSFSMDLMRYGDAAPKNVMDFLFVELLLWGQAQGYSAFDLGMAPLAGLDEHRLAPFLSRVGRLVFERGEEFYNFQGLRRYKDKYSPVWEPRYIAAPNKWSIPHLIADVGLLSSGGVSGLGRRQRKPSAAAAASSPPPLGQTSEGADAAVNKALLSAR